MKLEFARAFDATALLSKLTKGKKAMESIDQRIVKLSAKHGFIVQKRIKTAR